jgi:hypothetical protein
MVVRKIIDYHEKDLGKKLNIPVYSGSISKIGIDLLYNWHTKTEGIGIIKIK